jgi:hypothetical protein
VSRRAPNTWEIYHQELEIFFIDINQWFKTDLIYSIDS